MGSSPSMVTTLLLECIFNIFVAQFCPLFVITSSHDGKNQIHYKRKFDIDMFLVEWFDGMNKCNTLIFI